MKRYIVGMKTRARASAAATMATAPIAAVGRKLRKVSTSSPATTPYRVRHLRSGRGRRKDHNSQLNDSASSSRFLTETTATVTTTTATNLPNLEECVEDYCSGGEFLVTSGNNSDGFAAASCCSSNLASSSSESEAVKECATTSEIVADPEIESGETSSRLGECCEGARESDGQESPTKKSTVQIKMPSESEIEDFFTAVENDLHKSFSDKYNFDIVNDVPLKGRYEWAQVKP